MCVGRDEPSATAALRLLLEGDNKLLRSPDPLMKNPAQEKIHTGPDVDSS